jgi:hypothetical protein
MLTWNSAISIDPLGGISRLDTYFFVYKFSSKGLMKTAEAVIACSIVKSSAETSDVNDNTLRVLVNQCFETSGIELRKVHWIPRCEAVHTMITLPQNRPSTASFATPFFMLRIQIISDP